ncbi:hypothetical protein [Aliarcobacter cibarius]|uniref:Uncharacterized protein n=1 Tax=Aliarcobacter cibarius TaxID=255507 RepID=A0ABY2V445_9BACT|nr:hypothetical protein [Aliarcobacter cibarius]TLS99217.1 hypothetical protein FE247_05780 [Aliarcobacter cibarius]TLT00360.1 hypothetical protein FE245_04930 [Aliarcobacter cibarius]
MKSGDLSFEEMLSLTNFKNNPIFLIETIFLLLNENYLYLKSDNTKLVNKNFIKKFNEIMKKENINLEILLDYGTII